MIVESMIEAVGRAIANAMHAGGDFGMTGEYAYRHRSAEFIALGRAAIEAMREPTEGMVDAVEGMSVGGPYLGPLDADAIFERMIDAALLEQQP